MANCDFNHGLRGHVYGGVPQSSGHVSPQRHHSDDTFTSLYDCGAANGPCSNRTGSEWVTLSKSLLLQLVERICHLSFQTEVAAIGVVKPELVYRHMTELETERQPTAVDIVASTMECSNDESDEMVAPPSGSDSNRLVQETIDIVESRDAEKDDVSSASIGKPMLDNNSPALMLARPVGDNSPVQVQTNLPSQVESERIDEEPSSAVDCPLSVAVKTPVISLTRTSPKPADRFRFSADDVTICETAVGVAKVQDQNEERIDCKPMLSSPTKCAKIGADCTARRLAASRRTTDDTQRPGDSSVHRRRYIRAHRRHSGAGDVRCQPLSDVSRDVIVNCRPTSDDAAGRMTSFAARAPSRRVRRSAQQPWKVLNKSVVYRMLDAVLSQSAPSLVENVVASAAPSSGSIKRPAKNRIWNPAISSAPSSPEYTSECSGNEISHQSKTDNNRPVVTSPTFGAIDVRPMVDNRQSVVRHAMMSSLQPDTGCPSILRDLLDSIDALPVSVRRHSETAAVAASMKSPTCSGVGMCGRTSFDVGIPSFPVSLPVSHRRRHHSAGRNVPRHVGKNQFPNSVSQGFHNSMMFVDAMHGRDICNYFRSPDGLPIIASASSFTSCSNLVAKPLDYSAQTLGGQCHPRHSSDSTAPSLSSSKRKSPASLPEVEHLQPGVTPRWVAFNKGDVSTLFESLATTMMAADGTSTAKCGDVVGTSSSSAAAAATPDDNDDDDDVWYESGSSPSRTRVNTGSAESVFRRPSEVASEPVKWKSSLMRRMRDEIQSQRADHVTAHARSSSVGDDSNTM